MPGVPTKPDDCHRVRQWAKRDGECTLSGEPSSATFLRRMAPYSCRTLILDSVRKLNASIPCSNLNIIEFCKKIFRL